MTTNFFPVVNSTKVMFSLFCLEQYKQYLGIILTIYIQNPTCRCCICPTCAFAIIHFIKRDPKYKYNAVAFCVLFADIFVLYIFSYRGKGNIYLRKCHIGVCCSHFIFVLKKDVNTAFILLFSYLYCLNDFFTFSKTFLDLLNSWYLAFWSVTPTNAFLHTFTHNEQNSVTQCNNG